MQLVILRDLHGEFDVHKAGCGDLSARNYDRWELQQSYVEEFASQYEVSDSMYGPGAGSFYEENGGEEGPYPTLEEFLAASIGAFNFKPCTRGLPTMTPAGAKAAS
ncbi:MAG: hypothetical protein ACREB9_03480 [Thermoplasmata archaeon]